MTRSEKLRQNAIQQLKLAGNTVEQLVIEARSFDGLLYGLVDERICKGSHMYVISLGRNELETKTRTVANLAQLHNGILQAFEATLLALAHGRIFDHKGAVFLHLLVELHLEGRHLAADDALHLVRQVGLDVFLETTKQEWSKDLVKTTKNKQLFFFVERDLVLATRVGKRRVEPLVERLHRVEHARQDEVEQGPQFGQRVLQRRAGQDEAELGVVILVEGLRQLGLGVLHSVSFVNDHVHPLRTGQIRSISNDELVGGDADLPAWASELFAQSFAHGWAAFVSEHFDAWRPAFEF